MTTDLTDDFELDEEEFDWDVFVPDPDEADIAAEAAALDDEAELDLDDSDLDWEAALQEEPPPEGEARAGAAFERIVDTVRRSFEEPESESAAGLGSAPEREPHSAVAPELEDQAELELEAEFEPEVELEHEAEMPPAAAWSRHAGKDARVSRTPRLTRAIGARRRPGTGDRAGFQINAGAGAATGNRSAPRGGTDAGARSRISSRRPEPEYHAVRTRGAGGGGRGGGGPRGDWDTGADPTRGPRASFGLDPNRSLGRQTREMARPRPQPGPAHARNRKNREGKERSRVYTATIVLACLVLVIVAGALAVRSLHHATTATTSPPARSASGVSSPADAARIQTATDEVDSATTAARAGLASMTSFPTPANVATIINPYISSLQLYEAVLSGSKVPPSATSEAASAEAQARQDLEFLGTIHGLPPVQLGAYLGQVEYGCHTAPGDPERPRAEPPARDILRPAG